VEAIGKGRESEHWCGRSKSCKTHIHDARTVPFRFFLRLLCSRCTLVVGFVDNLQHWEAERPCLPAPRLSSLQCPHTTASGTRYWQHTQIQAKAQPHAHKKQLDGVGCTIQAGLHRMGSTKRGALNAIPYHQDIATTENQRDRFVLDLRRESAGWVWSVREEHRHQLGERHDSSTNHRTTATAPQHHSEPHEPEPQSLSHRATEPQGHSHQATDPSATKRPPHHGARTARCSATM
jgi:hypothetical protein